MPEPDTPVTATKHASGTSTSTCLEVVRGGAADAEREARERTASLLRYRNAAPAAEERPGERFPHRGQAIDGPAEQQPPAAFAGSRAQIDHVVGGADDGGVVLDHDDGVALIAQAVEQAHQTLGVARVQSDRRLVEDEERVHQRRADGRGQVDALELAARERARLAIERQVAETHLDQVAQPAAHLAENELGDRAGLSLGQLLAREQPLGVGDGHAR